MAGKAVANSDDPNTQHGEHGWDRQPTIGCAVIAMSRQHVRRDQRSDDRARLIERFLQTEGPTLADMIAGATLHRIRRGAASCLSGTLRSEERRVGKECRSG